jgi:hypothetical protein
LVVNAADPVPVQQTLQPRIVGGGAKAAIAAAAVLIIALALAECIHALQAPLQQQPERAVLAAGLLLGLILAAVPGVYVLRAPRIARPETAGLAFLSAWAVVLLAIYFFWVSSYVFFPADILIWAEGDFVNDILKFSVGYPLYSPPINNDSFHYVPGPQLLTYLFAWLTGKGGSIPAYRVIQVGYTAIAAFIATLCCRRILRLARPESRAGEGWLWNGFWYAALFLVATNSITNHFAHNLHGDALAQLATMAAYYLLLIYLETRSRRVLAAMTLLVPIGFLIKQSLLIWIVWYAGFLAAWGRSWKRLALFSISAAALFGATIGVCYAIWGGPFFYWIFYEQSTHPISLLRAFQHVMDSWAYFAAGLLGGVVVLRGRKTDGLVGAWLVWLGLIALEAYTSGIEWLLNHLGPGCLMAMVWFLAGLASLWKSESESQKPAHLEGWIRAGAVTAAVALMFGGMGVVRIPLRPISDDCYRYVRDIEKEFQGLPANQVLLDLGTWVYVKDRVIMGDRAAAVGSQSMGGIGDFSGFLSRIAAKRYSKILVRDFLGPDCWYEDYLWRKPSGIRQALLENYRETGRIPAAKGPMAVKNWAEDTHLFGEITILEPKANSAAK